MKLLFLSSILVLAIACSNLRNSSTNVANDTSSYPVLTEAFHTERDEDDNVDSPAVWHGENGEHWLLATAKEGNTINVYNAADGSFIERFGKTGTGEGEFDRPNGIWVIDNLLLVVERDNARVQIVTLPDFTFVGFMTHEDLRYPYGLSVEKTDDETYELFITDNFNPSLEGYPPEEELDERIHHYQFTYSNGTFDYQTIRIFGDISGEGILHKVESLHTDRAHNRLLIADEAFSQRSIKVYDLEGNFTGDVIPNTHFTSEPEGIALYACEDNSGYWIITDQHKTGENKFEIFDRQALDHLGGFKADITKNTDGIWLTQKSFGPFEKGAFYPVHDDGSVTVISWSDISDALSLERDCTLN